MSGTFRSFAIIPAAGESARMGQPKLLLPWGKSTVIEAVLTAWRASRIDRIAVVVRLGDESLVGLLQGAKTDVVIAKTPPPDMKSSVLLGLDHLELAYSPKPHDAWLLAPADMPHLPAKLIDAVLACHDPAIGENLVPTLQGQRGHPVLFPWRMVEKARRLPRHEGLNSLIHRDGYRAISCEHLVDASAWSDIDTPDDYQRSQQ